MKYSKGLILLNLIIMSLSCEDTINPPSNSASEPMAITGTVIRLASNDMILTAQVNPNGQSASYYFEYGLTEDYGYNTPTKELPSATSEISVSDTIYNLLPDTTYHYRIAAINPLNKIYGDDKQFITYELKPTAITDTIIRLSSNNIILTAKINPNGESTSYYFEYGNTEIYGYTLPVKEIGSGISEILVQDTIYNVSFDTMYHYRVVAFNSYYQVNGADKQFYTYEFIYPLNIGNSWKYSFYSHEGGVLGPYITETGLRTWVVLSLDTDEEVTRGIIFESAQDTIIHRFNLGDDGDTSYINMTDTFQIIINTDSINVNWTRGTWESLRKFPRFYNTKIDTLSLKLPGWEYREENFSKYFNKKGLIELDYLYSDWYTKRSSSLRLSLIEFIEH